MLRYFANGQILVRSSGISHLEQLHPSILWARTVVPFDGNTQDRLLVFSKPTIVLSKSLQWTVVWYMQLCTILDDYGRRH